MRIIVLTNNWPTVEDPWVTPGLRDQVEALRGQGIEIDLWIIRHGKPLSYLRYFLKCCLLNFKPSRYDLMHAYYGHSGLFALFQRKYPLLITFLGSDLMTPPTSKRYYNTIIGRIAVRFAHSVIVMTEEMKIASGRDDAIVIPFGVNSKIFFPVARKEARRQLGISEDEKIILFPWNPARQVKRFDLAEKAIEIVRQSGFPVRLYPVFNEQRDKLALLMNAADVMVMLSDHEGSPVAVREALACDLPIVSVDAGDVWQLISDVQNCYCCQREPADIAAKIQMVLLSGQRSDGHKKTATMDVAWSAHQVMDVYQKIINRVELI